MALTIEQIQENITNGGDVRQIINQLADYVQANPSSSGGDSGLALESYQNSAMSSAIMAYVFRDESDNIFRVYEPIKNNEVSRKVYAYADSIDKFAFDSADNFNNRLLDVKLVTVPAATKFQGCTLETMIINATNKTGIEFLNHFQKGDYGDGIVGQSGHGEEIYITGNNVVFDGNWAHGSSDGAPTFFDNLGADSYIKGSQFGVSCFVKGKGFLTKMTDCDFKTYGTVEINDDMFFGQMLDVVLEDGAYLELNSIGGTVNAVHLGVVASMYINGSAIVSKVDVANSGDITLGHDHSECSFGVSTSYTSAGSKSNANFIRIGSTTYEMGENTGAATLTAV